MAVLHGTGECSFIRWRLAIPCVHAGFPTEADDQIDGNARHHVDGTMRIGISSFAETTNGQLRILIILPSEAFNITMFQWNQSLSPYGLPRYHCHGLLAANSPPKGHRHKPGNHTTRSSDRCLRLRLRLRWCCQEHPHLCVDASLACCSRQAGRHSSYSTLLRREAKYLLAGCLDLENQSWEDRSRPLAP